MSGLYNYFLTCWKYNSTFTEQNLTNAVEKGLISEDEKKTILATPRQI